MKLIVKIFNSVFMALSALAIVLLFSMPSFSFYANVGLDVSTLSSLAPSTSFSINYDIPTLIGADEINIPVEFSLKSREISKVMKGNREPINEQVLIKNCENILTILHKPVDVITDFAIRENLKNTIKSEIYNQIEEAKNEKGGTMKTEDIMSEVGMDDTYFTNFAYALCDSANKDGATIDSVSDVLFNQIDIALAKAEETGQIDTTSFSESSKVAIKENLVKVLGDLRLINSDNTIKKLSDIPYIYLSNFLVDGLKGQGVTSDLDQHIGETMPAYADRLVGKFVTNAITDDVFQIIQYVCLGIYIGLFVFAGSWLLLLLFTAYRTFLCKRKYTTFFGPIFFLTGLLQIVLGVGMTYACKFVIPQYFNVADLGIPLLKSIIFVPRSYALATSLVWIVTFGLSVVYFVLTRFIPKEERGKVS